MAGPIDMPERKPGGKTEMVSGCLLCITALIVALFLAVPYWKQEHFHQKRKEGHHA